MFDIKRCLSCSFVRVDLVSVRRKGDEEQGGHKVRSYECGRYPHEGGFQGQSLLLPSCLPSLGALQFYV